jgi:hypothetical protein
MGAISDIVNMRELWIVAAVCGVIGLAACRVLLARRPEVIDFRDDREEQLTRRLAQAVGCTLADAQSAIQRELRIAPDQLDETILKRARYHYQREVPDRPCGVFRDRAPG